MPGVKTQRINGTLSVKKKLNVYQRIIDHVFRPLQLGRLTMNLPDGSMLQYGNGEGAVVANLYIRNNAFFKKCVFFGDIGFGESYVDGDWETDDITKVIEWMIQNVENHPTLMSDREKKSPVNVLRIFNNAISLFRKNTVQGSRKNIYEHYDLGNHFFQLFLDPTMTYSSAYFKEDEQSLDEAQYQKLEKLCHKLRLKQSDHLLEIGSGWGALAIFAAKNFGCRVTTVTISEQQYVYAKQRIKEEGLAHKIGIELKDYRKIEGQFDKVVSVEMLEAVGHEFYEPYFRQCHKLLKKDGLLALQVILSPDNRYESFRKNTDWIQKYIFPGSLLPSFGVIQKTINQTGDLCLLDYEDITMHYVRTLGEWHRRFNHKLPDVLAIGLDETFIRLWNYYLCYCSAAFKTRNISVAQMVFTRPNNCALR